MCTLGDCLHFAKHICQVLHKLTDLTILPLRGYCCLHQLTVELIYMKHPDILLRILMEENDVDKLEYVFIAIHAFCVTT